MHVECRTFRDHLSPVTQAIPFRNQMWTGVHATPTLMNTKRAFAVLELILVVAMIALVAGVIMPVLDCLCLIDDRAHATRNFARLARGISDYANDHNSALPAAGESRPTWQSSQRYGGVWRCRSSSWGWTRRRCSPASSRSVRRWR